MENMLSIRFEAKKFGEVEDLVFKGIRCSEDVAWKLAFFIGEIVGLDAVHFEVEDDEGVSIQHMRFDDVKYAAEYDEEEWNELRNEEVEDNICSD